MRRDNKNRMQGSQPDPYDQTTTVPDNIPSHLGSALTSGFLVPGAGNVDCTMSILPVGCGAELMVRASAAVPLLIPPRICLLSDSVPKWKANVGSRQ